MKKLIPLFLLATLPIFGALPPVWQGVAEVKAIVEDPGLSDYLSSGDILEAITKSDGGWVIKTNRRAVFVKVVPVPQTMPGPEKFELQFNSHE